MAPIERADLGIVNRFSFSWANTVTAAHENATSNGPVTPDLRAKPRCKTESNSRGLTSCDTSTNEDPPSADAVPDSLPSDAGKDGVPSPSATSASLVPVRKDLSGSTRR